MWLMFNGVRIDELGGGDQDKNTGKIVYYSHTSLIKSVFEAVMGGRECLLGVIYETYILILAIALQLFLTPHWRRLFRLHYQKPYPLRLEHV